MRVREKCLCVYVFVSYYKLWSLIYARIGYFIIFILQVTKLDDLSPIIFLNRTKAALNCAAGSMQVSHLSVLIYSFNQSCVMALGLWFGLGGWRRRRRRRLPRCWRNIIKLQTYRCFSSWLECHYNREGCLAVQRALRPCNHFHVS